VNGIYCIFTSNTWEFDFEIVESWTSRFMTSTKFFTNSDFVLYGGNRIKLCESVSVTYAVSSKLELIIIFCNYTGCLKNGPQSPNGFKE
jgi:hypothetical protein